MLPAALGAAEPSATTLVADEPIERPIAAEGTHLYHADLTAGQWRVVVDQLGIDIEVTATLNDGQQTVVDSPLDREGMETLLVVAPEPGILQLAVHAHERAAPSGNYRLRIKALTDDSPAAGERIAAEIDRTEAAQSYAAGATSRLDALQSYRAAAKHWRNLGEEGEETRDLYCAAVLLRIAGKTQEALEASQDVLPRWQALGDTYWEAATLNEIGLSQWSLGEGQVARGLFDRADSLWRALEHDTIALHAQNNKCLTFLTRGDLKQGLACYQPLLDSAILDQEPAFAATIQTNLGWVYDTLGEPDLAVEHYLRASTLTDRAGDTLRQAQNLNNLARIHRKVGNLDQALADYEEALRIFQELKKPRWQGRVLNNIAHTYLMLGEPQQAQIFFRESLALRKAVGDRRGELLTLIHAGQTSRIEGNLDRASASQQAAVKLATDLGDFRLRAVALTHLGWTYLEAGNDLLALDSGQQALELLQGVKEGANHPDALQLIGRAASSLGRFEEALVSLEKASILQQRMRQTSQEAAILTSMARAKRGLGDLESARLDLEAALRSIEHLRARVAVADVRAPFFNSRRETFELYIEILMALHRHHPEAGHDLEAFAASERVRARSLLDLLGEARVDFDQGVDGTLIEQRNTLSRRLNAKAQRRQALFAKNQSAATLAEAELEVATTLRQLDRVETEIRRTSPKFATISQPLTPSVNEIQRLLDNDTLLLEYTLGQDRSFLWLVSSHDVESVELPRREEIETLANRFHALLRTPGRQDRAEQTRVAKTLAQMVLGPVAARLGNRRLVVVADGALHYVPFAVLPLPNESGGSPGAPLLTQHEVVHLPSATVLIQLRKFDTEPPAPGWLAMIADPITARDDLRLADTKAAAFHHVDDQPSTLMRSGLPEMTAEYPRLPGSRQEAEAILALAPSTLTLSALGFQANLGTILRGDVSKHRIVHFATHGLIDNTNPSLSGLALSLFNRDGQPQPGLLRLRDIYNLDLNADLVVLSGCQTALGRELGSEGLVGLTRGFMNAGATRVIASLWRIEDKSTAELMTRFYESMWIDGMQPASALRKAQLSLRQERRWQDPYYWGMFVLQGDW